MKRYIDTTTKKSHTYRTCHLYHSPYVQGICMDEIFKCRWFSIAYIEEYCHICNKTRRKYIIFR